MTQMRSAAFTYQSNQPLIGIPFEENGKEVIRYFTEKALVENDISPDIEKILNLAGSWRDLTWEDMEAELNKIRHQSTPTPPVNL